MVCIYLRKPGALFNSFIIFVQYRVPMGRRTYRSAAYSCCCRNVLYGWRPTAVQCRIVSIIGLDASSPAGAAEVRLIRPPFSKVDDPICISCAAASFYWGLFVVTFHACLSVLCWPSGEAFNAAAATTADAGSILVAFLNRMITAVVHSCSKNAPLLPLWILNEALFFIVTQQQHFEVLRII